MHHLGCADPVRKVERDHLDTRERLAERADPLGTGAIAVADEQGVVVEPDRVASFGGRGRTHPRRNGHAGGFERRGDGIGLVQPHVLAGAQQRRARVADEHGVVNVDRVRVARVVLGHDHIRARLRENRAERLVLRRGRRVVGSPAPAVALDVARVHGQRPAHEHALERSPHRLAAVRGHGPEGYATALSGVRLSRRTARSAATQSIPIAIRVSRVALPRCGASTTFSSESSASVTSGSRS